jgi:hypothetical protein
MAANKEYDVYIVGLNELLRDLKNLDREANNELRAASQDIAARLMVPAWQNAARNGGPWGENIAASIKARRDRIPSITIGAQRPRASGGATPTMLRYPSDQGVTNPKTASVQAAFGSGSDWMRRARTYIPQALKEWGQAVDRIVDRFNNDRMGAI